MSFVTSKDGTQIGYDKIGTGPALILVDAASGFRGFGPMGELAGLLASDFTVYTYDRRGRGESGDTLPFDTEREIEDLQALIHAAGGSAFLYGFSSGAVLAMHTARHASVTKVAMLEPPLELDEQPADEPDLAAEIDALVKAGKRREAVEHFNKSIGVPEDVITGMKDAPFWPALENIAHTLVYDLTIISEFPVDRIADIRVPMLILASEASDARLHRWAQELSASLPNASFKLLPGEWHGVAAPVLAPALKDFFLG
jgi:pimeloyl-ACP methyl ester carboxylesterase